jgi:hypothetical protein
MLTSPCPSIHSQENGSGVLLNMKAQGLYTEEAKSFDTARYSGYTTFGGG